MTGRRSYRRTHVQRIRMIIEPNTKLFFGMRVGAEGLTWCYKSVARNYFNYAGLQMRRDASEETLRKTPVPRQRGDPFELQTFNDMKKQRDSLDAELKKCKWTAKLVQMFPPKDL